MKTKIVYLAMSALLLAACEDKSSGGASGSSAPMLATPSPAPAPSPGLAPAPSPSPDPSPAPSPTPSPSPAPAPAPSPTVSVTYYTLTKTIAPTNGWINKTIKLKGSCTVLGTTAYCWDDGLITQPTWWYESFLYGGGKYLYWEYMKNDGPQLCRGGCTSDYFEQPVKITAELQKYYFAPLVSTTAVNNILNTGTPTTVTCQDQGIQLDCGSFVIVL